MSAEQAVFPGQVQIERIVFSIDGFNRYFVQKSKNRQHLKWLDIYKSAQNLTKPYQKIIDVNYFTARVRNAPEKEKRQTYLKALEATSDINISYGRFQPNIITCYHCGHSYSSPNEKMTDVNIASRMLIEAFLDKHDVGLLISGDSDHKPPIREIRAHFPKKKIIV